MGKNRYKGVSYVAAFVLIFAPIRAVAQSSSSTNYRVDQTIFSTGGEVDATSAQYRASQTAGDLTIGQIDSANYRVFAGFNTTEAPYIEFVVTGANIDLGYLDTTVAKTASGQFYVRAWQAHGYAVKTVSDPPYNNDGTTDYLNNLTSPTGSSPGNEQFGINLKDNALPNVGAEPQQSPDGSFSFGYAAAGYNTADQFKYVKNDVIARSDESTSVTIFTISYLFNISETTPSGEYVFVHNLVVVGTY